MNTYELANILRGIISLIGNVDHSKGHGALSAELRGNMLNGIRDIAETGLRKYTIEKHIEILQTGIEVFTAHQDSILTLQDAAAGGAGVFLDGMYEQLKELKKELKELH